MKDVMLILHFLGLAMGVGTSFAFMFLGIAGSKMEKEEGIKFAMNTLVLSRMGHIGLGLLILSGGYLMTPYWKLLGEMPLMITKLILVLVLGALLGILGANGKRAKKGDPEVYLKKNEPLGKVAFVVSLTIVILAVLNFH